MGPGDRERPLVGREQELTVLMEAIAAIAGGQGGLVFVEGEAGIGKTRLLTEALLRAPSGGVRVLLANAREWERRRPFGALLDCLEVRRGHPDPARANIADLVLGTVPPSDPLLAGGALAEARAVEAIVGLLADLGAENRLVIALEDLQWADPSTLTVLQRLAGHLTDIPLLLIGTSRPLPRRPELDRLLKGDAAAAVSRLVLGPLDEESVAGLAGHLMGRPPGPDLFREIRRAGGNPLFVMELVAAIETGGGLREDGRITGKTDDELAASLVLTILHRLSFLRTETLEVLRVASVFGSRFDAGALSLVLGRTTTDLLSTFEEALTAGLLCESEGQLAFRHDVVREALYYDLPKALRLGVHRDIARALSNAGAPPESIAEHLVRGASPGDAEAARMLQRAASSSAGRAPAIAAELLDHALRLVPSRDPSRDSLLADQAVNLLFCGRGLDAEAMCRDVLSRTGEPAEEGTLRRCLVHSLVNQGRMWEAVREAEAATASPTLPPVEAARLRAWGAFGRALTGDLLGAECAAHDATRIAASCHDDYAACIAASTLGMAAHLAGRSSEAAELLEAAVQRADHSPGQDTHRFPIHVVQGLILISLDRFDHARAALGRAFRVCEDLGTRGNLPLAQRCLVILHFWSGAWDDATAEHEASIDLADETGTRDGTVITSAIRALIALHRGDRRDAEESLTFSQREFAEAGPQFGLHWTMWARGLLLEAQGRVEEAAGSLSEAWGICTKAGLVAEYPVVGNDVVRLAVATGQLVLGREVVSTLTSLAEANPGIPSLRGAAVLSQGLLEDRIDLLEAAVDHYESSPRRHECARAQEDAAVALATRGHVGRARTLAERAMATYGDLLAAHDLCRCEARLRAVGVRRRGGARPPRSQGGWEALTPTELRVAELVADGLSNPEIARRLFVSRHTVHTHVAHILAKLGLKSRVELAAQVARRR